MGDNEFISEWPLSRKEKFRSSLCFPCCFNHHHSPVAKPRMVRCSSQLKEKCSNFISRIGRHNRRHSADYHYDALSYALNFEDEASIDERNVDEFRSFSSRLPPSPSPRTSSSSSTPREIAALN